ncbi:hypothetical protein INR77_08315 [Erythrobacter sp. SCSIO 43205]|uniref:hypothetical protein n=1 Tax=Erythrobacter sp. SCSIO 43205 TaxID=2779361 RepID=UPI001CA8B015|nr:hypothetical protein [Erythrobacter sp. SCSIO 43205]UAB76859.1 hypothetical protein INR77_08315 [Erythrobacter sp. SCSIO 43205]
MDTKALTRSLFATSVLATFTFAAPALAEGVTAGSLIENTATATYEDGEGEKSVDSNTVTLTVDELLDVTVTSLDGGPVAAEPGEAVLTYEVTNQGNGPEAFTLIADPAVAGNNFDTTVNLIAIDTNGNGVYDDGVDEVLTGPETTSELAADEAVTVFVVVTVPGGTTDGDTSQVELRADAATGTGAPGTTFAGAGVNGTDAIVGTTGASAIANGSLVIGLTTVELTKAVSVVDPFGGTSVVPGSVATFTLSAEVLGDGTLDALVITDAIPADTTYVDGSLALDGNPLTDAADTDQGTASDASGISVDIGTVAGGDTYEVTFDVTID